MFKSIFNRIKGALFVIIAAFVLLAVLPLFAQTDEGIPPVLASVFSQTFILAIAAVISITKLIRNVIGGIKGWPALVITGMISIAVGFVQYGKDGIWYALGVGLIAFLVSAGIFKGTKVLGKAVLPNVNG